MSRISIGYFVQGIPRGKVLLGRGKRKDGERKRRNGCAATATPNQAGGVTSTHLPCNKV